MRNERDRERESILAEENPTLKKSGTVTYHHWRAAAGQASPCLLPARNQRKYLSEKTGKEQKRMQFLLL